MSVHRAVSRRTPRDSIVATSLIAVVALTAALAGCVFIQGSKLTRSADRLQHNAHALGHDALEDNSGTDPGYARDAEILAADTRRFRETLSAKSASDQDVKVAFERVSYSYQVVHDDIQRLGSHEIEKSLRPVTTAYQDVQSEVGGYSRHQ
jgi:hypothetical protein